jgi:hypothetical protein
VPNHEPFCEAARIVANPCVAQFLQQADRLLTERSRGAAAIHDDRGVEIGDEVASPARDVGDGEVQGTGNVCSSEGLGREHVEEDDLSPPERADELVAGDGRHSGPSSHGRDPGLARRDLPNHRRLLYPSIRFDG